MIKIGTLDLNSIYNGTTTISKVMLGTSVIWEDWKRITTPISFSAETGYVNADATVHWTADFNFNKPIKPENVTMKAKVVRGSATWMGAISSRLFLYNDTTNQWEQIIDWNPQSQNWTHSFVMGGSSLQTTYSKARLYFGGTSGDGSKNHIASVSFNTYWQKGN